LISRQLNQSALLAGNPFLRKNDEFLTARFEADAGCGRSFGMPYKSRRPSFDPLMAGVPPLTHRQNIPNPRMHHLLPRRVHWA
jgi:hypothetical protein